MSLTDIEIKKTYAKIVSGIHKELKDHDFKKDGAVCSYRIRNEIYQSFEFQKGNGRDNFSISTCIRPIFWHKAETTYLICSRRVGHFEESRDKWYPIDENYNDVIEIVWNVIKNMVLPIYNLCDSPTGILDNSQLLKENRIYREDVLLFCSLKERNKITSKLLIDNILEKYNEESHTWDWWLKEKQMFNEFRKLIDAGEWSKIIKVLNANETEFYQINKRIKK